MISSFIIAPLFILIFDRIFFSRSKLRNVIYWTSLVFFLAQMVMVIFPVERFMFCRVDNLSRVSLLSIGLVAFVTVLSSRQIMKDDSKRRIFISLVLIAVIGMNAVSTTRDLFSLYVFMEIASIASFVLIALNKERDAFEGAFKYVLFSAIATVFMLSAIGLILLISGGTSFNSIRDGLRISSHNFLIYFALGVFLSGLFIKGGVAPFHGWVMDAYTAAPASVSIFLAGIATKATGVYTLVRFADSVFLLTAPIKSVLLFVSAVSIIMAAIAAFMQDDMKRMLSYSSVSQVGYIIMGLGCGTPLGITGAMFHFFNHAVFKSLLFINSASLESRAGTRNMSVLSGMGKKMPVTALTSLIAGFSTAGVPPMAGFWSKLIIITALWLSGYRVYAFIAALASILTLGYILKMQRRVFWSRPADKDIQVKGAGFNLVFAETLLAAIIVSVGIFLPFWLRVR
ncbi:MAG: proton-conducting transporter membrane subunit [Candidatus Omnitrophota bacterium]